MIITEAQGLRELGTKIFVALGAPKSKAEFVAETLVEANLCGHDSHGAFYFPVYGERIRQGYIQPKENPRIVKETPTSAYIDGRWGFGQIAAKKMIATAVEKASTNMVAAVGGFNINHIGRLGYYTTWVTEQNMIGMMFANVGNPIVSPFHGAEKAFGTNPASISTPTSTGENFLMDYATSLAAAGKLSVARAKHVKVPSHWIRDKNGNPTDDPNAFYEGAVLTGSRASMDNSQNPPSPNGVFCIAINPEAFIGLDAFKKKSSEVISYVKSRKPERGETVLIPGDPERISKKKRLSEGIPLPEDSWDQIIKISLELGLDPKIALKKG
jgi:LDH2 family malate/lactate/ureidoglycolate dehydrogenase